MKVKHYIDKDELWGEIEKYYKHDDSCKEKGREARMSDTLGTMIMDIAEKLMSARNFSGYPYREQMVGDAILCMVNILTKRQFDLWAVHKTHVLESCQFKGTLHIKSNIPDDSTLVRYTDVEGDEYFFLMEPLEDRYIMLDGELVQAYVKTTPVKATIERGKGIVNIYQFVETGKSRGNSYLFDMEPMYDKDGELCWVKNNPFGYLSLASSRSAITRIKNEGATYSAVKKLQVEEYVKFLNDNPDIQQQRIDDDTYNSYIEET